MKIGIDASRAFVKTKTGIEEYSYQIIRHLCEYLEQENIILYLDPRINEVNYIDYELPEKWNMKFLRAPVYFWTQIRLSLEMLFAPVDILFVPAHTLPLFHPRKSVVTVHGLEYEFCPRGYSTFERLYMRWSIKYSCRWAKVVIAVSENTKRDLVKLYNVPEEKIEVIYNGVSHVTRGTKHETQVLGINKPYLLFIGRLEERKNICGIIEAFEILKEKYNLPHKLVLAGTFANGGESIKHKVSGSKYESDIMLPGFVKDEEKYELMRNADVFLFPSFYEGFGLPILEAQSVGTAVVTSNISSMPEVARLRQGSGGQAVYSAVLVDPKDIPAIAEAAYKLISDEDYKNDIIKKGLENAKRFSWEKCAKETAQILKGENI